MFSRIYFSCFYFNSCGRGRPVYTRINAVNYVSPRSWLANSHFVLGFFLFVVHMWHPRRDRAEGFKKLHACDFEHVLLIKFRQEIISCFKKLNACDFEHVLLIKLRQEINSLP